MKYLSSFRIRFKSIIVRRPTKLDSRILIMNNLSFCVCFSNLGARESWEYDSGARDLQSPDLHSRSTLQKLLEYGGNTMNQQVALQRLLTQASSLGSSVGGSYLELANTVSTVLFTVNI